jgi:glycosyltransferase involved in cell wall biosynthesis
VKGSSGMKLSVVMPCYNAADTIEVQLDALAAQEWHHPWEVVVADNRCTDETIPIVESYRGRIPNLRVVKAWGKQGQPYALNLGVQEARGEFLLFCDADDEVAPGWVAAMGNALEAHDFVASRMDSERLSPERSLRAKGNRRQQTGVMRYTYVPYLPFAGSGGLGIRRELHEAVGGFDEEMVYLLDTDYCWRVQLRGIELTFVPEALVHIRHREVGNGWYRQARNWGEYNVLLLKKFQPHGMPKPGWSDAWPLWKDLIRRVPRLYRQTVRDKWIWALGYRIGHVRGSLKHRFFAP